MWLDTDEAVDLCTSLGLSMNSFIDDYVQTIRAGWVMLKGSEDVPDGAKKHKEGCIFLADDGKKCTIYESRPIQCRLFRSVMIQWNSP